MTDTFFTELATAQHEDETMTDNKPMPQVPTIERVVDLEGNHLEDVTHTPKPVSATAPLDARIAQFPPLTLAQAATLRALITLWNASRKRHGGDIAPPGFELTIADIVEHALIEQAIAAPRFAHVRADSGAVDVHVADLVRDGYAVMSEDGERVQPGVLWLTTTFTLSELLGGVPPTSADHAENSGNQECEETAQQRSERMARWCEVWDHYIDKRMTFEKEMVHPGQWNDNGLRSRGIVASICAAANFDQSEAAVWTALAPFEQAPQVDREYAFPTRRVARDIARQVEVRLRPEGDGSVALDDNDAQCYRLAGLTDGSWIDIGWHSYQVSATPIQIED